MFEDLVCVEGIGLAAEHLLLLLGHHLVLQRLVCLALHATVLLSTLLHILLRLRISLSLLLDHELLVALLSLFQAAHRLVIAVEVVLCIVLKLVVLQLGEVQCPALLFLVHFLRLELGKNFVSIARLLVGLLLLQLLLGKGLRVVASLLQLLLALLLAELRLLSLLVQESQLLNFPLLFFLLSVYLVESLFFLD